MNSRMVGSWWLFVRREVTSHTKGIVGTLTPQPSSLAFQVESGTIMGAWLNRAPTIDQFDRNNIQVLRLEEVVWALKLRAWLSGMHE
ncbi:hypothetical protein L2E82_45308 [Cichorium intybus]|uniref:Uncharacterized protein n=1 Tax=Cichorium intybus TaxID=13427 RepID=A0ACB8ZSI3_CICIN|nr:hypothetical protein L2E82_45308 [Cichorium intybus]